MKKIYRYVCVIDGAYDDVFLSNSTVQNKLYMRSPSECLNVVFSEHHTPFDTLV